MKKGNQKKVALHTKQTREKQTDSGNKPNTTAFKYNLDNTKTYRKEKRTVH